MPEKKETEDLSSDTNGIQIHNHLVCKPTLNDLAKLSNLAKWLSVRLRTKWLSVRIPLLLLKLQISRLFQARNFLTIRLLNSANTL